MSATTRPSQTLVYELSGHLPLETLDITTESVMMLQKFPEVTIERERETERERQRERDRERETERERERERDRQKGRERERSIFIGTLVT